MRKLIISAAAIAAVMGMTSGAFAELPDECDGDKSGWTESVVGGGDPVTTCYSGGSGDVVDCASGGNHIVVTRAPASYTVLLHPQWGTNKPNGSTQCLVPDSQTAGDCDVSRAKGTGNTSNFEFYCD